MGDDRDRSAERVACGFGVVDRSHHLGFEAGVDGAQRRAVVDPPDLLPGGRRPTGADRAESDDAAGDLDAEPGEEHLREGARGDSRRGLARRGALEDVAQVAAQVLLAAGEVGVAGPRALQAPQLGESRIDLSRRRRAIARCQLAASRFSIQSAIGEPRVSPARTPARIWRDIALDLHAPPAAMAVLPAGEIARQQFDVDREACRHAGEDRGEAGPVAFAGGGEGESAEQSGVSLPEGPRRRSRRGGRKRSKGALSSSGKRTGRRVPASTQTCSVDAVARSVAAAGSGESAASDGDPVLEGHAAAADALDPAGGTNGVAVAGRRAVGEMNAGHQQEQPALLDLGVVKAGLEAEAGARQLAPDDVVGVMDHAHLVGFEVAHLDFDVDVVGRQPVAQNGLSAAGRR